MVHVCFLLESRVQNRFFLFLDEEVFIIMAFLPRLTRNVIFIQVTISCLLIWCRSFGRCLSLLASRFSWIMFFHHQRLRLSPLGRYHLFCDVEFLKLLRNYDLGMFSVWESSLTTIFFKPFLYWLYLVKSWLLTFLH